MTCYHPIKAFRTSTGVVFTELSRYDIIGDIKLPCGMCIGCRADRVAEWRLRVMHEASMWPENCFVTLTYGRDKLPPDGSLCHRDFQLFMKRLRKCFGEVRFFMCGEYGPLNMRPHYHACLFNVSFQGDRVPSGKSASGQVFYNSPLLEKLWKFGRVSVQDLNAQTAGYCAGYIMKKPLGILTDAQRAGYITEDGVIRRPEYAAMSLKPGIGATWYAKYGSSDVHRHDFGVLDGLKQPSPAYYDRLLKRSNSERLDELKFKREVKGKARVDDHTDDRLVTREVVHVARVRNQCRGDLNDAS